MTPEEIKLEKRRIEREENKQLDVIYELSIEMIRAKKFDEIEEMFRNLDVSKLPFILALGYATAFLVLASRSNEHQNFCIRAKKYFDQFDEYKDKRNWDGLIKPQQGIGIFGSGPDNPINQMLYGDVLK